jgi:hypothetical protein
MLQIKSVWHITRIFVLRVCLSVDWELNAIHDYNTITKLWVCDLTVTCVLILLLELYCYVNKFIIMLYFVLFVT